MADVSLIQRGSISACHAEDLGSIPSRNVILGVDICYQCREYYLIFTHSIGREIGSLVGKTY